MINIITDLIQSFSIIILTTMAFLLVLHPLNKRLDQNSIAIAQLREETREEVRANQESQAICGCGHHQCFHDENGCDKKELYRHLNMAGNEYERDYVSCGCKRYTGPEQLPMVIP